MVNNLEQLFKEANKKEASEDTRFSDPQEEIAYLRQQLSEKEKIAKEKGVEVPREDIAKEIVHTYKEEKTERVVHPDHQLNDEEVEGIALKLSPEEHDPQIQELFGVMMEKGIKNTLNVVAKIDNAHIEDDFHRFLVQYLQSQHTIPGLVNKSELYKALDMRLFEVTLPAPDEDDHGKGLGELVSMMEQFLAGMQSVSSGLHNLEKNYYALEIALPVESDQVIFYVCIPDAKVDLFEKQIFGMYDEAKIEETFDDYNVFHDDGQAVGAIGKPLYHDLMQIQTYENMNHDPMNILLNSFSKLDTESEGVSLQILIRPAGDQYIKEFSSALDSLKKGENINDVTREGKRWIKDVGKGIKGFITGDFEKSEEEENKQTKQDENAIASVGDKLKSSIVETNIRLVASAKTTERAKSILHEIESTFQQFTNTEGNGIAFERIEGDKLKSMIHDYTFRMFNKKHVFRLNFKEISTMYHFPIASDSSPQLKQAKAGSAPVPVDAPDEGLLLGFNKYRHKETKVYMAPEDRVRHMYVIGQTGTGKTNIMKNMIIQDIRNGNGCCFIDPHGSDIDDILSMVPKERIDDVIYFDPASTARPMAFNMLEYDERFPEQKSFVIDEMLGIFNKLFDMKATGGPMFEQYFRNATALVVEDPSTGSTLLDVSRVLADTTFRELKLSRSKNPIVNQFWEEIAGKAGGEASLENIVPYITSKFDVFMSNEIMRPIVSQQKSAFNFREVMDKEKILLVNLSKGRLGEINANLLGLIMVGKILMAALSRVDAPKDQRPDFYLYIDEFQNVTTDSIGQILSEARKYRLSLNIAHQFIAQLDEDIKNAVFGNVGSIATFRVSSDDAQYLESRYKPTFNASDIMKLDNYNAYMSMLGNGQPIKPFNLETYPPEDGNLELLGKLKELSSLKYGRPREEVEAEIMAKFKKKEKEEPNGLGDFGL